MFLHSWCWISSFALSWYTVITAGILLFVFFVWIISFQICLYVAVQSERKPFDVQREKPTNCAASTEKIYIRKDLRSPLIATPTFVADKDGTRWVPQFHTASLTLFVHTTLQSCIYSFSPLLSEGTEKNSNAHIICFHYQGQCRLCFSWKFLCLCTGMWFSVQS